MSNTTKTAQVLRWAACSCLMSAIALPAHAQGVPDQPPKQDAKDLPAQPSSWASSIKLSAQGEAGIDAHPFSPAPGGNFGQLFTDHNNQVQLNQILLTAARPTDPKATGYDVGFKLQVMYGSDARYTHFLGELDHAIHDRYQLDVVEANVVAHLPWFTEGGIDLKVGQYSTPIGYETIDPSTNPFYSHSYIFNFGIPLKHTGVLAITHVNPMIDVYLGADTGVNTSFGKGAGDNNGAPGGIAGLNFTLFDSALTILALTHIGPENPSKIVPNADSYMRYLNDILVTYKATDALTFTTELNFIKDEFARAEAYGAAQYVGYALNPVVTLNARAEVFRDNAGFFVGAFPGNLDFINAEEGNPATVIGAPRTTYGALTLGVTFKPTLPAPISTLMFRPEIRYDRSLSGTRPFNNGADHGAFTIGGDVILGF